MRSEPWLRRQPQNAKIAGVCAGCARRFGWEATWVRVAAILLAVVWTKVAVASYAIAWLLMESD